MLLEKDALESFLAMEPLQAVSAMAEPEAADLAAFQKALLKQQARLYEQIFELLASQEQRLVLALALELDTHFAGFKGDQQRQQQALASQVGRPSKAKPSQRNQSVLAAIRGDADSVLHQPSLMNRTSSHQSKRTSQSTASQGSVLTALWGDGGGVPDPPGMMIRTSSLPTTAAPIRPGPRKSRHASRPDSPQNAVLSNLGDEGGSLATSPRGGIPAERASAGRGEVVSKLAPKARACRSSGGSIKSSTSVTSDQSYLLQPEKPQQSLAHRGSSESIMEEEDVETDEEFLPRAQLSLTPELSIMPSVPVLDAPRGVTPLAESRTEQVPSPLPRRAPSDVSLNEKDPEGNSEQESEPPLIGSVRTGSVGRVETAGSTASTGKSVLIRAVNRASQGSYDVAGQTESRMSIGGNSDGDEADDSGPLVKKAASKAAFSATIDEFLSEERHSDEEESDSEDHDSEDHEFEVSVVWTPNYCKGNRKSVAGIGSTSLKRLKTQTTTAFGESQSMLEVPAPKKRFTLSNLREHLSQNIIMKPYSMRRIVWEFLSFLLLCYDIITIPLEVFSPENSPFTMVMTWTIRIFWTLDIFVSFTTAFINREGETVAKPKQIAKQYLSRQFPLDIVVVSTDWIEVLYESVRAGSVLKSWRMLRIARVLRLQKFRRLLERVSEYMGSQKWVIIAGILRMLVLLLLFVHMVSCLWFVVGGLEWESNSPGWATGEDIQEATMQRRYLLCFHFAIAIFNGEHTIMPNNQLERTFVVIVLYISFIGQTWIVSSITTRMTHLEMISARQSKLFHDLDRFMQSSGVSRELTLKVTRNAKHALHEQERNAKEANIELFQVISQPLMTDLHFEIFLPCLHRHPFLRCHSEVNPGGIRNLCHTAMEKISILQGDVVFHSLETTPCPKVLLILSGTLSYLQEGEETPSEITTKNWVSEANLWTADWLHCGTLQATTDCTLLVIDAKGFQETLGPYGAKEAFEYAEWFVERLNDQRQEFYTDIGEFDHAMGQFLLKTFPQQQHNIMPFIESLATSRASWTRKRLGSVPAGPLGGSPGMMPITPVLNKSPSRELRMTRSISARQRSTEIRNTAIRSTEITEKRNTVMRSTEMRNTEMRNTEMRNTEMRNTEGMPGLGGWFRTSIQRG